MKIEIPGYKTLDIRYLVFDYNGTVAIDGGVPEVIREKIMRLSDQFQIYILTADTYGDAKIQCARIPAVIKTFQDGTAAEAKADMVEELGAEHCACIGNGRNDVLMFQKAALSVVVLEKEGAYAPLLQEADLCVRSIENALGLFLKPVRIVADLRG